MIFCIKRIIKKKSTKFMLPKLTLAQIKLKLVKVKTNLFKLKLCKNSCESLYTRVFIEINPMALRNYRRILQLNLMLFYSARSIINLCFKKCFRCFRQRVVIV